MKTHCHRGHDKRVLGRATNGACLQCKRDWRQAWCAANPEQDRARQRKKSRRRLGILNLPEAEARPGDPCECCGIPIIGTPQADHDHATGEFRGWLCKRCNVRLGVLENSAWRVLGEAYLDRSVRPGYFRPATN